MPVVTFVRKIHLAKLEKKSKHMIDFDIVKPIQNPTEWVNGLVVVEKPNGKLRVCINPRPLNKEMFS